MNWNFIRYDHSVLVGDLYILQEGQTINIGDVVEFTSDPPTIVQSGADPAMYEVRRGCATSEVYTLTGTGPDDAIGFSRSTIHANSRDRVVTVLLHGFGLATACSVGDIQPNTPVKCCSIGQVQDLNRAGLTALEVANYKLAKSITLIPVERLGVIFKGD